MANIKIDDIVIFKAEPNSGEMIVTDIKLRHRHFPHVTEENPVVLVKFWDAKKHIYNYDSFYANHLKLKE